MKKEREIKTKLSIHIILYEIRATLLSFFLLLLHDPSGFAKHNYFSLIDQVKHIMSFFKR